MAIISRNDIQGIVLILAILLVLGSVGTAFVNPAIAIIGVILFLVLIGLIWLSRSEYAKPMEKAFEGFDIEIVLRISVIVILIGVLLNNILIIGVGFIIGAFLMFSKHESMHLDIMKLKLSAAKSK